MDEVANSGNDEFYTPFYAIEPLLKYVACDKLVWCPFDTQDSLIVKALRARGNTVMATHLSTGNDFFATHFACDVIISNPPYSLKGQVFERLFSLGIPFAMLVGVVGLFESQRRFEMFATHPFEIMYLNKRVAYFKSYTEKKPSLNPPFSSVWLTQNVLPKQIVFEHVDNTKITLQATA
jgi:hypothetical protein